MSLSKIGRYQIQAELGRGAMGIVYRGFDPNIGRTVAIKTILLDTGNPQAIQRLQREAQAAGSLSHPNIVTVYDAGEDSGLFYIAMELLEGETLHQIMARGLIPVEQAIAIVEQVGAALDYAHSRQIIHRDVKPANIMVSEGRVKVMDFGIAKIIGSGMTTTGEILGTPAYMSPELVKGLTLDGRSDLFSLGAMFYQMVTGVRPFAGDSITTILYKILQEEPPAPSAVNRSLSPGLDYPVLKTLAKDPAARYPNCSQFLADLKIHAALQEVQETPDQGKAATVSRSQASAERTLAAIMFTDMVGYSALTQQNESLALNLLAAHRQLLRPIFLQYGGREIKTIGDAFLVEFSSALEAARCAMEMQKALGLQNAGAPLQKQVQVRIGIHVGDVVHKNEDVFGDAVNIASRIEPLASAGGICVSEDVERQIHNKIKAPLRRIGKNALKNIALPVEVYEIVLPGTAEPPAQVRNRKPILAVAAVALLALVAGILWQAGRTPTPVPQAPSQPTVAPAPATPAPLSTKPPAQLPAPAARRPAGQPPASEAAPEEQTKRTPPAPAAPVTLAKPSTEQATPAKKTSVGPPSAPEGTSGQQTKEPSSPPTAGPLRRMLRAVPFRSRSETPIPSVAGRVAIHTEPQGARILVNGKETPYRSPVSLPLAPGRYRITVERRGFASETRDVVMRKDELVQLRLELKPD